MNKNTRVRPILSLFKRRAVLSLFSTIIFVFMGAQNPELSAFPSSGYQDLADLISEKNVRKHVFEIAGDSYGGRGAGYEGERKAAKYISREFEKYGLTPVGDKLGGTNTFFQEFQFHSRKPEISFQTLSSKNVLGFIEGSDKKLSKEIVVIGCHYDGQGKAGESDGGRRPAENPNSTDKIWNSADDNASSVAVLLEMARVISTHKLHARRSILFIAFGAEEHALNGSAFYVENPVFSWDRHVAMLNIEKLGRVPDKMPITASGGTSPIWAKIISKANRKTSLDVKSLIPELISDTDHYPFAMRKIPAMVIGMAHEEDTHLPSDSPDKISYDKLALRGGYVLTAFLELANTKEKMPFTGNLKDEPGFMPVAASEAEMNMIGLNEDQAGYKVSMIIPDSPAKRSGMKYGDVIISKNGKIFARRNIDDERVFFRDENQPENVWILEIVRNRKKKTLKLQF